MSTEIQSRLAAVRATGEIRLLRSVDHLGATSYRLNDVNGNPLAVLSRVPGKFVRKYYDASGQLIETAYSPDGASFVAPPEPKSRETTFRPHRSRR